MESSAVIYANSVLGARTNTEGRESTSAAMLTGKIPDWGLHRTEHRYGTHRIDVDVAVDSVMDWGMLGYYVGDVVQERIPVVVGRYGTPEIVRLKHFGAAASSSGGVEMYHIVGVTPEAESIEAAFGPKKPVETFVYGKDERRRVYDRLNANASDPNVDFVMLGCPHAAIEQLREAARLLDGKKVSANCALWIFTSRAVKSQAHEDGILQDAQRRGRGPADRHVLGLCSGSASGNESGRARLRQAGALSAGDPGCAGVVRIDERLHQRGADAAAGRESCRDRLERRSCFAGAKSAEAERKGKPW